MDDGSPASFSTVSTTVKEFIAVFCTFLKSLFLDFLAFGGPLLDSTTVEESPGGEKLKNRMERVMSQVERQKTKWMKMSA